MAAGVGTPVIAPKRAHAGTVAMTNPPRKCPIQLYAALYKSRPMLELNMICPMKMNRGIVVNVYMVACPNAMVVTIPVAAP